ncbi:nuclear transport factor 2 family protein [uncultured Psychroserpens sp.]|uniref:nuclear transport factor 2 family protein n=1 Tax=uncultured Psychroserpens sp. TaxID=255436 RepID=UPI00262B0FE8|nr:nuclear transport factor 2 family protein [uncultured Psychroserpens sp.]
MPTPERIEEFIARVETNEHDKAIEEFYTENASIQENESTPRVGRANLIENERKVLSRTKSVSSKCIRPFFISENEVVIKWNFRFVWKDNSITEIEEIAVQHWEGNRISKEKFYYDPIQMQPKK